MKKLLEPPEGIIITISQKMIKEKGYKNWLFNYFDAMESDDYTYWMRLGAQPKHNVVYVYLCIGGKVRFRSNFVCSHGQARVTFIDGTEMTARAWIEMSGPLVRAPYEILMKGFRGFRYTHKLF